MSKFFFRLSSLLLSVLMAVSALVPNIFADEATLEETPLNPSFPVWAIVAIVAGAVLIISAIIVIVVIINKKKN